MKKIRIIMIGVIMSSMLFMSGCDYDRFGEEIISNTPSLEDTEADTILLAQTDAELYKFLIAQADIDAYRILLEQKSFNWDEKSYICDTSEMQFSLINADDDSDTKYLILKNERSYAAAGTQHLLVYKDGELKTLWGYGQNCIYIQGFVKGKSPDNGLYLIASGGRCGVSHQYVLELKTDGVEPISEQHSYIDDQQPEYFWNGNVVNESTYSENLNNLLNENKIEFVWYDNTTENRDLILK